MGRPKAENPKDIRFSIRLDADTKAAVQKFCLERGMTTAEAIREGIRLLLVQKK